jgi:3-oxoacyl-[acyl-carrier protein] reductase
MLEGRTAVITGGSRGIGRAIALGLAGQGARVAIVYAGQEQAAREVCRLTGELGVEARAYQCDVADFEASRGVCEAIVADFGQIDILVNNAGITRDTLMLRMSESDFDQVVAVDLKGAFNFTRHLMRHLMRSAHGRVITITSVVGLMGNVGQANYAAAKAGLVGLTKSWAREMAGRRVTCNAIAPGLIATELSDLIRPEARQSLLARIPLGRAGSAEDVAAAALFLASDQAAYITGEILRVDGGMSM